MARSKSESGDAACDVLVVGGGVGGCAAAMAAARLGARVILTEPAAWIGGQLSTQAVPPDEHPWIEEFGCTGSYRAFREAVRAYYRANRPLNAQARNDSRLNPGKGWVSRLCHEPRVASAVLEKMFAAFEADGSIQVLRRHRPLRAHEHGDRVEAVTFLDEEYGFEPAIGASMVLDATETGDLLPLAQVEYVVGAESQDDTGEPHALPGPANPKDVQGFTWCFAMGWDPKGEHVIRKPSQYERWKAYRPSFWPGPLLGWTTQDPVTLEPRTWTLFSSEGTPGLFEYRRIVCKDVFEPGSAPNEVTIVNWPQNDYFESNILDEPPDVADKAFEESRQLSLSLLYWLQTEAPRPDGGAGYPGLFLCPETVGTDDGFALAPYIRESRRIRAEFTVREQHVAADCNPGKSVADPFFDSVGIGSYRIDLHPSAAGRGYVDIASLPFQIPLGALIPVRIRNLLPACKNIGVTHVTNGCYRLHPVEWNIGEAAGLLAAHALRLGEEPRAIRSDEMRLLDFQRLLVANGVPLAWPATLPA